MNINSSTSSSTSSASNSSGYYNRITGLASGLDTDSIVKSMMQADQTKIDKANQQKQLLGFQQSAYRDIISDVRDFYSKYLDMANSDTNLILSTNYSSSTFTTSDTSGAVTAEGLAGAQVGNYKVQVNSLATKANLAFNNLSSFEGKSTTISINGKSISLDLTSVKDDTSAMTAINNAISNSGVDAKLVKSDLTGKYILQTNQTGNGQSISFSTSSTSSNIVTDVNSLAGKHVKISAGASTVDVDLTGAVTDTQIRTAITNALSAQNITNITVDNGTGNPITINGGTDSLSLSTSYDDTTFTAGITASATSQVMFSEGENLNVNVTDSYGNTVNNKYYTSNSFTIDSVKFTASDVTSSPVSFAGKTDVTDLKKRITDFVTDYNKLIDTINTKLQEKKNNDYPPLTDAQRAQMTTDQITQWETKTKEGLLRNDDYLTNIVNQLRSSINTAVSGSTLKYTDLGIDFTNDYTKPGELTIDDTKLTTALENNPDQVLKLFTSTSNSDDTNTKFKESGIMQRFSSLLYDNVYSSDSEILKKAGYDGSATFYNNDLQTQIDAQTKLISDLKEQFTEKQTALYQKFANLESLMNSYNTQSSYLTSMLGS
ncbi:flagellar filament capping protein FliD [Clostridium sp. 19966]|uniref:flagellar filament capping protein FliD n=1 Tax=Clostridium sp. 19966 TaxID=2768166 RepID=UPI0028DE8EE2|nr:flagellar filament capping protein FliD [Clostridium sp. 19966]MDT8716666.1 flagellar filament capping protein FliD [Clostridium sp. 19966]